MNPRLRKPRWTRLSRVNRLNEMILYHMPRWTAQDVADQRERAEVWAYEIQRLMEPPPLTPEEEDVD